MCIVCPNFVRMFILDRPTATEPTYIYLLVPCDDGRYKKSTKLKVLPTEWSADTERPIVAKDGRGKITFTLLNRLGEALDRLRTDCQLNYEPFTKAKVEAVMQTIISGKEKKVQRLNFSQCIILIVDKMRDGTLTTDKEKNYEPGTIYNYGRIGSELQRFSKERGISVEFSHTTMDTYNALKSWCYAQSWTMNYTGNIIKVWKGILKAGFKLGLHKNEIFANKAFRILAEDTDDIYLTLQDIEALRLVDLSNNKRWELARDWFLIACFSAFRASDLKRITKDKIGHDSILMATEKTDEVTEVPLHPVVKTLLKKYKGPPPFMHENEINELIKHVCRKAGLDEPFLYCVTEGGKRKEYYYQKWQMCSCHTARRSFITNARLLGMPDNVIMKIAAVRSEKTLKKYDKMTVKEAARLAANHPFFAK